MVSTMSDGWKFEQVMDAAHGREPRRSIAGAVPWSLSSQALFVAPF